MQSTLAKPVEKSRAANVTVKLDEKDRGRLQALSTFSKRSSHFLMKEAIQAYLDKAEAERAVLDRVDAGINHYEATGLHITLDEMRTWAKSIRLDRNTQLPACHT